MASRHQVLHECARVKRELIGFAKAHHEPAFGLSPPKLGEHTAALLKEMGYSDADVEGLRSRNVVA